MSSKGTSAVMGEQDQQGGLVPKLRFPEFQGAGEWKPERLGLFVTSIKERVGTRTLTPMSVTSGLGLVSQIEKFGRSIAGQQYRNYIALKSGDFAYNKSATKQYPQGFIARYIGDIDACVPNSIFTCFRIENSALNAEYLNYLLLGNLHGRWLANFMTVGARAHGSLNIDDEDLLSVPIPLPLGPSSEAEQQKIADCLLSIDALIAAEAEKLKALKEQKKGLMQELFPASGETTPLLRFPEFQGAGGWKGDQIGRLCNLYQAVTLSTSDLNQSGDYLVYGANGVIGMHDEYNHEASEVIVTCRGATCGEVTRTEAKSWINGNAMVVNPRACEVSKDYIYHFLKNDGLKSVISGSAQPQITRLGLSPLLLKYPGAAEQQRIADCLSSLDALVAAQGSKIDGFKAHKNGLMQQLFPVADPVQP